MLRAENWQTYSGKCINRPLDLDDNFNLSLLSRHAVTIITSQKLQSWKLEGTKWYWSHGSQFLEGTRPTGPIGWLRLCINPLNRSASLIIYTASQKMNQLWNGIAQNYKDQFWYFCRNIQKTPEQSLHVSVFMYVCFLSTFRLLNPTSKAST